MADISWNTNTWSNSANWRESGEEWSTPWGNSESPWFGSLYPRIHTFLPTGTVLEIAPEFGRWSRFLLAMCDMYDGADLSMRCVDTCRNRFRTDGAGFHLTDGNSLSMIRDRRIDFVFSFDSLVHATQIMEKLTDNGAAFIHHSTLAVFKETQAVTRRRGTTISTAAVADMVNEAGGCILRQEIIAWQGVRNIDVLTLFGRPKKRHIVDKIAVNDDFMKEAEYIKNVLAPWSFNNVWKDRSSALRRAAKKNRHGTPMMNLVVDCEIRSSPPASVNPRARLDAELGINQIYAREQPNRDKPLYP
jgi:hypothetical protein